MGFILNLSCTQMKHEIDTAMGYWASQLSQELPMEMMMNFTHFLRGALCDKYALHWYEDTPSRGQAYREIVCDSENRTVDPVLIHSAQQAGFCFLSYFSNRGIRMWVDPGEVEVAFTAPPTKHTKIFQQQSRSNSPVSPTNYYSVPYYTSPQTSPVKSYSPTYGSTSPRNFEHTPFEGYSTVPYHAPVPYHSYNVENVICSA